MPPKKSKSSSSSSHSARAAAILSSARKAAATASKSPSKSTSNTSSSTTTTTNPDSNPTSKDESLDSPISLQSLMSHISTSTHLPMRESMALSAKLIKSNLNTVNKLTMLSPMSLDGSGIDSKSENGKKVLSAFRGRKAAGLKHSPTKSSTFQDIFAIPTTSTNSCLKSNLPRSEPEMDYIFNEVLNEESLKGKFALINRAPVMCAWATIILERLGFKRSEALSLAQCYISQTSHSRGVSIGKISNETDSKRKREHFVGNNQPHFQLMGIKIPLMRLKGDENGITVNEDGEEVEDDDGGEWRGIDCGEIVGPERAFNYMRKSMAQTLPLVIGSLTLLADSYLEPPSTNSEETYFVKKEESESESELKVEANESTSSSEYGAEKLHEIGYSLYCDFRPETGGEWGKKSKLEMDRILSLRKGRDEESREWERRRNGNDEEENKDKIKDE